MYEVQGSAVGHQRADHAALEHPVKIVRPELSGKIQLTCSLPARRFRRGLLRRFAEGA
jgi:hypothetical protein